MTSRYQHSLALSARAEQSIPLGSQTFSKSRLCFPYGAAPLFIERGNGAHVWDVDGNEYLDFASGLLAISLGYCDPDVNEAVMEQLSLGSIFSLPHRLETEVAEQLIELIPCAEMVRFGKNGTDATSACIRLSRAVTGRERVAVCGYHGWQDWYIGSTTRHLGVPECVRELTHRFDYNDLASLQCLLEAHPGEFAAVILEPMNVTWPTPDFLPGLRQLCDAHGALLIFDETITGFRYHLGGAQSLFGVTPDLAAFGKGMANGFPISAVVGRRQYMKRMEDIFFSGTFGGDVIALAAANAVIKKMRRLDVPKRLAERGQQVLDGLDSLLKEIDAPDWLHTAGHPSWSFLLVADSVNHSTWLLKSYLIQELCKRGILTLGSHNMNLAHSEQDVAALLATYRDILPVLIRHDRDLTLASALDGEPIQPVFKVR
ncbi:TPA: aminotransferase class III-fold pyridoxal phosphate-dependent enzyme [Aeromonas veronii]|uniref:Aspartate aminotransferase family protein n=1 Tax=Aeromonas veronii TaxID=654 RepID=A0ABY3MPL0_AERVE|nr:aminotransferase class III-fold pyridoxal phosphate-dependent enzyme [Aeromonas veronii]RDU82469.1 aspartate aminotransferase family protein [Aeromonas veronii]RDU85889.1 aspartate aminotransferase family protein [Aeromonas veronii]RDU87746.1 aspartate aminotransferase family protein [Aeromonas veronii]RDU94200.1 aspartate aminotransferase family protein [Aeromonas veronii]TEY55660.1 aspartate aminotransferase family protein [Aeromonas veronii]